MKHCWDNIKEDNSIEKNTENIHTKNELFKVFEEAFNLSDWEFVKWIHTKSAPYQCIISDGFKNIDVLLYLKNITNAGWDYKPHIKRVQVSNPEVLNLDFNRFDDMHKISLIIGYYNYEKPIFVSWDAYEFRRHKTNRSCYIDVDSLIKGYQEGYLRTNFYNQKATLFTPRNLSKFLEEIVINTRKELNSIGDKLFDIAMEYYSVIKEFDTYWDGKDKVIEMKSENYNNWKQMEWPAFYFEYIMQKIKGQNKFFNIKYGNTEFDLFDYIPWDLKVHSMNSSNPSKVITNDLSAINKSIKQYGKQGFIILQGKSIYERNGEFREWINDLKGGLSNYQKSNIKSNTKKRRRKKAFELEKLTTIVLCEEDLMNAEQFQDGFKNSNNTKRKPKLILDLRKLPKKNILFEKKIKD